MATIGFFALSSYAGSAAGVAAGYTAFTTAQLIGGGILATMADQLLLMPMLMPRADPNGPRFDDLRLQSSSEGTPLNKCYGGSSRLSGQVLWQSKLRDIPSLQATTGKGGGYDMSIPQKVMDIAVGYCRNEVDGFNRLWADGKQFWTDDPGASLVADTTIHSEVPVIGESRLWRAPAGGLEDDSLASLQSGQDATVSGFPRQGTFVSGNGAGANVLFFKGAHSAGAGSPALGPVVLDANASSLTGTLVANDSFTINHGVGTGIVRYWIIDNETAGSNEFNDVRLKREGGLFGLAAAVANDLQVTIESGNNGTFNVLASGTDLGTNETWVRLDNPGGQTIAAGNAITVFQGGVAFDTSKITSITFYNGTDFQLPDPTIQADLGVANTQAYRKWAYVVIEGFNVTDYGNRPPNFTGRVTKSVAGTYGEIIEEIAADTRIPTGFIDASSLTAESPGYLVQGPQPAAQQMQPVMVAGNLAARDESGALAFYTRDNLPTLTVLEDHVGACEDGQAPNLFRVKDADDLDLPTEIAVRFIDPAKDYQTGVVIERYRGVLGDGTASLNLQMSMHPAVARAIGVRVLMMARINRQGPTLFLPPRYTGLVGENMVLTVPAMGQTWTLLTQKVDRGLNGLIEVTTVVEDPDALEQVGMEDEGDFEGFSPNLAKPPPALRWEILDLAPLQDEQSGLLGFYYGVGSRQYDVWAGAALYMSTDGGASYALLEAVKDRAVMGVATTALGSASGASWDLASSVTVELDYGELESVDAYSVLNGANRAVLGSSAGPEVIGWTTATLVGTRTYTLTGLLRGLRDTAGAIGAHATGDTFTLLSGSIGFHQLNAAGVGVTRLFKAVAAGASVADATPASYRLLGATMRRFSVAHVAGTRDGSDNLTVTWIPRTRRIVNVLSEIGAPNADADSTESYEVDFLDGPTVVRTKTASTPTVAYSAAEQTTDGLTPGDPVTLRIYAMSETVGRGTVKEETV